MIMTDAHFTRNMCVRGFVFLLQFRCNNSRVWTLKRKMERERKSISSNCRCFRLTTHSHGLMAWNCYRTCEWLAANIFRWEIEKHSRETGAHSQRREKNNIFEVKNSSSLREDVLAQSSHFKKWPILLYVIFVFESILFSFLFFFYSSLLHFTIIHTMIAIHSDTSSDCTCKPTRLPNMHRLRRQTVDDDVQHKYVEWKIY